MRKVAVIGLGQFGFQVATGLSQKGFEVIGFDKDIDTMTEIKDLISQALEIDSTDEIAMRSTDIRLVDIAIVSFGTNVQASLLTTALLQQMGIGSIYVRAISHLQERILTSMGIHNIINIEKDMGIQLTNSLSSTRIARYIDLTEKHSLIETKVPSEYIGKALKNIPFRQKLHLNVVGIKSQTPIISDDGEASFQLIMNAIPDPSYALKRDDILMIAGEDHAVQSFLKLGIDHD